MTASIITVGDEILIGQIIDSNSAWIAEHLNLAGIEVRKIISIGDDRKEMQDALEECVGTDELVLMTGGLGPTKDDISKKVIAEFLGVELVFSETSWEHIQKFFQKLGRTPTQAHRDQCFMPQNAELLYNKLGTAPGMWMEKNQSVLVSMPGVPYEMKYILSEGVLPRLRDRFQVKVIEHRTILTAGQGESWIAERIQDFEDRLPQHIKLAYLPNLARVRLRLSARGEKREKLKKDLDEQVARLKDLIGDLIYGYEKDKLEEVVGNLLREKGLGLATAESCTGGYLAHLITSIPGSSDYFLGSVVAYSNEIKKQQLDVREETLQNYGAVSEPTVKEMVGGLLKRIPADIGVSISGIAGPGGGTPEKPVGTIWLAVGDGKRLETRKLQLGKDRLLNIQYTAVSALNMVRKFLMASE
jgi:nicotinamide-nucleotide amidase